MLDLARLRQEYLRDGLTENDLLADPLAQFTRWFDDARNAGLAMPNAMSLATVSATHTPSSRLVLLKGVDHGGFVFYTHYGSHKGQDIAGNAQASLLFAWLQLERQVRITGTLTQVSAAESDTYFNLRPLASRHAAIASPQSETIASRAVLEKRFEEVVRSSGDAPQRPAHWGGYRLLPTAIEFWQGRENRLHDRLLYRKSAQTWAIERLAP